uniref:NADH-ubiquinone oxidoreductase chain 3 n=1 Tax=Succinea erythrophana TaxID=3003847 RepID=A0A9E9ET19_9EUPU|nr:NADH dehydrogenase subunit 3 [Succinea erythrophana]WAO26027.1 NADH dehydrogenase subunit 3 [Succinea erythrophana]
MSSLLYMFLMTFTLSCIFLMIYMMVSYSPSLEIYEKKTPFECGFDPISSMRSSMSTRFFLLLVLFLIFDIEISLLFPFFNLILLKNSTLVMLSMMMFILLLFFGLLVEWSQEVLEWI